MYPAARVWTSKNGKINPHKCDGPKHRGIEESVDAVDGLAWQDHYKYSFGVNTRLCGYDSCGDGSIPKPPGGDEHPEAPATSMWLHQVDRTRCFDFKNWRFPKMGVPPNHPWWDFPLKTIHCWGTPTYGPPQCFRPPWVSSHAPKCHVRCSHHKPDACGRPIGFIWVRELGGTFV